MHVPLDRCIAALTIALALVLSASVPLWAQPEQAATAIIPVGVPAAAGAPAVAARAGMASATAEASAPSAKVATEAAPLDVGALLASLTWQTNDTYPGMGSREATRGGTLRCVSTAFPATLRTFGRNANSTMNRMLEGLVYETLLDLDPITFAYAPALARRWAIGDDKKTFVFELDPRAHWSDGTPVSASDVVETYKMFTNPDIDDPFTNDLWKKYEVPIAVGTQTVIFRSKELNWRAFMSSAVGFVVFPGHVLSKLSGKAFLDEYQLKMMPGTGPYKYESSRTNEEIILSRRTDWWQENLERSKGLYNFDRLHFIFIEDENLVKEKFKKGELDYLVVNVAREWHQVFTPAMNAAVARGLVQRRKVYTHRPVGVSGLAFNMRRPPFDDIRVRRAFAHLYNREKMMDKLFFNEYEYLDTFYANSPFANPDTPKVRYNPDRAVELLEEAGWLQKSRDSDGWLVKDGERFEISLNVTSPTSERFLTIFQEELEAVGIKLNLKQVTWATDIKEVGERSFQLSYRTYVGILFPNPEASFHSKFATPANTGNIWGFRNARIDAICASYPAMFDPKDRIAAVREIDGIVSREQLYAFGWFAAHTRLLFWNRFGMPPGILSKHGDDRSIMSLWWFDKKKADALDDAQRTGSSLPIGTEIVRWWDEHYPPDRVGKVGDRP